MGYCAELFTFRNRAPKSIVSIRIIRTHTHAHRHHHHHRHHTKTQTWHIIRIAKILYERTKNEECKIKQFQKLKYLKQCAGLRKPLKFNAQRLTTDIRVHCAMIKMVATVKEKKIELDNDEIC